MAKLKIIGITESKGTYQGFEFHNLVLNLTTADDHTIGYKVETAKIKWKNLDEVFDLELPENTTCENYFDLKSFSNLLGRYCHIYYDKYRAVSEVKVEEAKASKPDNAAENDSKSA